LFSLDVVPLMKGIFPRDLFWTAVVPFVFAVLTLAIGAILFPLWSSGFPLVTAGGTFTLLLVVTALLLWRRHRRSTYT
jgi:hypothetical protein